MVILFIVWAVENFLHVGLNVFYNVRFRSGNSVSGNPGVSSGDETVCNQQQILFLVLGELG